jgi:hypothetical protein
VEETWQLEKPGQIQLAVGFDSPKGNLLLEIISPAGEKIHHKDSTSFIVEIQDAPQGIWRFRLVGETLPFVPFPFTLLIGEK